MRPFRSLLLVCATGLIVSAPPDSARADHRSRRGYSGFVGRSYGSPYYRRGGGFGFSFSIGAPYRHRYRSRSLRLYGYDRPYYRPQPLYYDYRLPLRSYDHSPHCTCYRCVGW